MNRTTLNISPRVGWAASLQIQNFYGFSALDRPSGGSPTQGGQLGRAGSQAEVHAAGSTMSSSGSARITGPIAEGATSCTIAAPLDTP